MSMVRDGMSMVRDLFTTWQARLAALGPTREGALRLVDQPSTREGLIKELLDLQQQDREDENAYQLRLGPLSAELEIIQRQATSLRRQIDLEHAGRMQRNFERDARRDVLKRALADGCPAQVDEFLDRVKEDIETLQQSHKIEPRIAQRLAALRDARQRAEELRTAPLTTAAMMTELRRLEQTVGDVSQERSLVAASH